MENVIIAAISFLAVLVPLVIVHELGHFVTAKLAGVVVQEFGFGYPPRLFAVKWKGTEYSINILPLGGFVKLLGEEDPGEPGSLASKGVKTRLAILASGSAMNAIFPIALFSIAFMMPGPVPEGPVKIVQVMSGSPAEKAGLRAEDVILSINGEAIIALPDVGRAIQKSLGTELEMALSRNSEQYSTRMTPRSNPPPGEGATGIVISNLIIKSYPVWEAVPLGFKATFQMVGQIKSGLVRMVAGEQGERLNLTGPIGIAQLSGEVAKRDPLAPLGLAAFLSINLAILNMLPIPALDGGRSLFVIIEGLRGGKRVPPEREGLVHLIGFAFLMALILIISANDLMRIYRGENLLP